jgi:hypothetical protein
MERFRQHFGIGDRGNSLPVEDAGEIAMVKVIEPVQLLHVDVAPIELNGLTGRVRVKTPKRAGDRHDPSMGRGGEVVKVATPPRV